jgi:hypothetical protein
MKVAVLKERRAGETRVAATPETVKKLIGMGCTLAVEAGAGLASGALMIGWGIRLKRRGRHQPPPQRRRRHQRHQRHQRWQI